MDNEPKALNGREHPSHYPSAYLRKVNPDAPIEQLWLPNYPNDEKNPGKPEWRAIPESVDVAHL